MAKNYLREYFTVYAFGGTVYCLIEVIARGFTHWSMLLTGGLAFLLIHLLNTKMKSDNLILKCLAGCVIITCLEFIVGCVVNRGLELHVWDYSAQKFNILGQICPLFSMLWFLICIPAVSLSCMLQKNLR